MLMMWFDIGAWGKVWLALDSSVGGVCFDVLP